MTGRDKKRRRRTPMERNSVLSYIFTNRKASRDFQQLRCTAGRARLNAAQHGKDGQASLKMKDLALYACENHTHFVTGRNRHNGGKRILPDSVTTHQNRV